MEIEFSLQRPTVESILPLEWNLSTNPSAAGFGNFLGGEYTGALGGCHPQREHGSSEPLAPCPDLRLSSICLFLSCSLYKKLVIVSRALSLVL